MVVNKKAAAVIIAIIMVSGLGWIGFRLANESKGSVSQGTTQQSTAEPNDSFSMKPIPSVVDGIIEEDIQSIRIFEGSMSDYTAKETPFFSKPDVGIMFFPKTMMPLTPEVISELPNRIKIISKNIKKEVRFSVDPIKSGDSNVVPLLLQLIDAPKEDLLIHFVSMDGQKEKIVTLFYTEPFNYTVTSEDDPEIAKYDAYLEQGMNTVRHLQPGKLYKYRFQFTHDVNRESVQHKLTEYLKNNAFQGVSLDWENDRSFILSIDFRHEANAAPVGLSFNGVRNTAGYTLSTGKQHRFQPAPAQALYRINLATSKKDSLFASSIHYNEIDVSPNGKYGLAAEVGDNEMHSIYAYSVIDLNGKILKSFGMDEIRLAKWSPNGNALIYLQKNNVMLYDLPSGNTKVTWAAPNQEKNARIVSLDNDPTSETTVIGWGKHDDNGRFTYDLYVLSDYSDSQPRKIQSAGSFSCYEGPCIAPGYRIVKKDEMYYEVYGDQENTPKWSAYKIDLASGEKKEEDLKHLISDDDNKRIFELSNGKSLWIQKLPVNGKEQWIRSDPFTGKQTPLMETSLGLFKEWMSLYEIGEDKYLIHLPDQNWKIIDTRNNKVSEYVLIPKEVNQVHKLGTQLYFFSNEES
ncbi:hypothetical protein QFZ81_003699 [Paenibacillus sp. V4I9]|uniref:hypothetical protein n=1 Tax=Paenibacillus sp. V4I9 TaxID=3042308 RepID=UPI002780C358|nr:hypothetical protein [Paenibacillus sp. V4I9]MDQ0888611.1 hypothetical protein [Paenibacillus sp. V4I9]